MESLGMEALTAMVLATIVIVFGTSVFALFRPLPDVWLPTRKRAGITAAVAFVLMAGLTNLLPEPEREPEPAQETKVEAEEPTPVLAEPEPVQEQEPVVSEEDKCRYDSQCWGEKHMTAAHTRCSDDIERLAQHDFEWTTGWGENIFSGWIVQTDTNILYVGDKIKFQNGFGVFSVHTYYCNYNPDTQTVLQVRAERGRMSKS